MIDTLADFFQSLAGVDTLFIDMNGTFMFGHDRLDPGTDFYASYLRLGGRALQREAFNALVERVVARLDVLYRDRAWDDRFPRVAEVIEQIVGSACGDADKRLLEATIADHELGQVPPECCEALHALAERYQLVVVSNLWSAPDRWRTYLDDRLGSGVFAGQIYSSEVGVSKPGVGIYEAALRAGGFGSGRAAMLGDDLVRDVIAPSQLGIRGVWVNSNLEDALPVLRAAPGSRRPLWQIRSLRDFASCVGTGSPAGDLQSPDV